MKRVIALIILTINLALSYNLTPKNFYSTINKKKVVLVKFWAPWCAPCSVLKPEFEEASKIVSNKAIMASYNVDLRSNILFKYHINMIPTMVLFKNSKEIDRRNSIMSSEDIAQWVLSYTK